MKNFQSAMKLLPLAIALVLALETIAPSQEPGLDVPFETIQKHVLSNMDQNKSIVITNEDDWQALWQSLYSGLGPTLPHIDFSQKMVIAILRGQTAPLNISIKRLDRKGKVLTVFAEETLYNPACAYPAVVTRPYHIIVTEKVKKKVRKNISFEIEQVIDKSCVKAP